MTEYLKEIAEAVSIPCLRKDFTVDGYMIYEAKMLGASGGAADLLTYWTKRQLAGISPTSATSWGLSALTEAHDEEEVKMALNAGARIIGVNNRNLRDFSVDSENSRRLRKMIPEDVLFVSESGVSSPEDVSELRKIGADAVLIGETLMRASDKKAKLNQLRGDAL